MNERSIYFPNTEKGKAEMADGQFEYSNGTDTIGVEQKDGNLIIWIANDDDGHGGIFSYSISIPRDQRNALAAAIVEE